MRGTEAEDGVLCRLLRFAVTIRDHRMDLLIARTLVFGNGTKSAQRVPLPVCRIVQKTGACISSAFSLRLPYQGNVINLSKYRCSTIGWALCRPPRRLQKNRR